MFWLLLKIVEPLLFGSGCGAAGRCDTCTGGSLFWSWLFFCWFLRGETRLVPCWRMVDSWILFKSFQFRVGCSTLFWCLRSERGFAPLRQFLTCRLRLLWVRLLDSLELNLSLTDWSEKYLIFTTRDRNRCNHVLAEVVWQTSSLLLKIIYRSQHPMTLTRLCTTLRTKPWWLLLLLVLLVFRRQTMESIISTLLGRR